MRSNRTMAFKFTLTLLDDSTSGRVCMQQAKKSCMLSVERLSKNDLSKVKKSAPAIYVLRGGNQLYIGKSEDWRERLFQHAAKSQPWWEKAYVFTLSHGESFSLDELSDLEHWFYTYFKSKLDESGLHETYRFENKQEPKVKHKPTDAVEEFADQMVEYLELLDDFFLFRPLDTAVHNQDSIISAQQSQAGEARILLHIDARKNTSASAYLIGQQKILLLKGAVTGAVTPSLSQKLKDLRATYHIPETGGLLMEDVEFTSPSAAASFVLGSPNSGTHLWLLEDGSRLKDYQRRKKGK